MNDLVFNNNLIEIFDENVKSNPDKIAVVLNDESITYLDLREKSYIVAENLYSKFGDSQINLAVSTENAINYIIAILGILRAGYSYIPIGMDLPDDYNSRILNTAKCEYFISTSTEKKNYSFDIEILFVENLVEKI